MKQQNATPADADQVDARKREAQPAAAVARIAHTPQGVVRSTFVLHPSHERLAGSLERMEEPRAPAQVAAAGQTAGINRESVLTAMLAHEQGLTAAEISVVILGRNDERAVHRISAHLARETKRGLVVDQCGRGVKRRLTVKGREVAAQMELTSAQGKARQEQAAKVAAAAASAAAKARINGVFAYARKIELGLCVAPGATR